MAAMAQAAESSFDYSRASNVTEKSVCQDVTLAKLDRKMAQTYAKAHIRSACLDQKQKPLQR